ncbi:MAG TPA: alpha/beta fold hydrolase [Burkholderiaceae bacterium]|nr:alpha/beta fold hydrolase [Burkholderiaceae bacterium]
MSRHTHPLDAVEAQTFALREFALERGGVLSEARIAWEAYGTLAPDRRNVVLLTHGFTSHQHMAGRYREGHAPPGLDAGTPGNWPQLVGPGLAIDTDRWFVVSSNMLGSSWGSTGPRDVDPRTGKPHGPAFPHITVGDIVRAQKLLLDSLGVQHLVAVAGPSYGGYQAFQWAVQYPAFMHGIVAAISAPKSVVSGPAPTRKLIAELAADPQWNGGWYYERGGIEPTLVRYRIATLERYGIDAQLALTIPHRERRERAIEQLARQWARVFDANSMVVLRRALETFDTTVQFDRIEAKVLYVLSRTDQLFPPSLAPDVMRQLAAAGVDARYVEIDSELGHMASGHDAAKWARELARFMASLPA